MSESTCMAAFPDEMNIQNSPAQDVGIISAKDVSLGYSYCFF
jgi:hypothetical protein